METMENIKIERHSSYNDSGKEWLGEIPASWEVLKAKYLWKELIDLSSTGEETLLSVSQYTGVNANENDSRSGSLVGYKKVRENDLVINIMLAWLGGLGLSSFNGIVSPAYAVYRLTRDFDAKFIHYLYRTSTYLDEFARRSKGVVPSRWRMYTDDFGQVLTLLPSKSEQTRIATFLDQKTVQIDQAIAQKERLIELLKERKQILIQRAVTRGLDPNVRMKDSGVEWIGEVPEHWEVKRLKYVAEINYGISPNEKTYNDEGIGTVLVNGPVEYSEEDFGYTRSLKWTTAPVKFAKKGSLLFCLRGSTTGRLNICHQDLAIGRGCAALNGLINQEFFTQAIIALRDRIVDTFKGSTFPSVTSSDLDNYIIPIPPIKEQTIITTKIETATQKIVMAISCKQAEIEKLKEYKATLINSAVTGKIKIS